MKKIIYAIDTVDIVNARKEIDIIKDEIWGIKIGLEFFCYHGVDGITKINDKFNLPIFLDLKFHDIPNTVSKAIQSILSRVNVSMMTLHASGGKKMMEQSIDMINEVCLKKNINTPILLGVTLLTSLDQKDLNNISDNLTINDYVLNMAKLSAECKLGGIVCSFNEIELVRNNIFSKELKIITPGIRLNNSNNQDQKRVATPLSAISLGSDYLVIGRDIRNANDKLKIVKMINEQIIEGEKCHISQ